MLEGKVIFECFNLINILKKQKSVINIPVINYWFIIIYRSIVKSPIALLQTLCNDIIWFEIEYDRMSTECKSNITNTFGSFFLKKKVVTIKCQLNVNRMSRIHSKVFL